MAKINPAFPFFTRNDLIKTPKIVARALMDAGVCYISGFEQNLGLIEKEFHSFNLKPDSSVKVLKPVLAKVDYPATYNVLYAREFKRIKRQVLGPLFKDEIEIFCQHTGPMKTPPSNSLHFDKRFTFKAWYYINDISEDEGPMRVVPLNKCGNFSPIDKRKSLGTKKLFEGTGSHQASGEEKKQMEEIAEFVTGPKGTLFLHITEAWHGASIVSEGHERKIVRAHSRPFTDNFLR